MSITDKVNTMKVIAVGTIAESILQTTAERIARTTELGMPYEVYSLKPEFENKLFLMLISRTFARRLGQTRHLLVTYLEDPQSYTPAEATSADSDSTAKDKSSEAPLPPLKRQLTHISNIQDMVPKSKLALKPVEDASGTNAQDDPQIP